MTQATLKKELDSTRLVIRTCRPGDIESVRRLAADTAHLGCPCEGFFPDRELLADLIMGYYVRYEPEHTWVAEYEGEVIGYLSGGFDECRYSRYMLGRVVPRALWRALLRGRLWDGRLLRMIRYNVSRLLRREALLPASDLRAYPVHIHQNMRDGYRGMKIGRRLIEACLSEADRCGKGVRFRALRREDNFKFFERYGFRLLACARVPSWERWLGASPLYFMEYGRKAV